MASPAFWKSPSGVTHEFEVCDPATVHWSTRPGIYLFCYRGQDENWWPIYIGQTSCFRDRPGRHEMWPSAAQRGATAILAKVVHTQAERDALESLMIGNFNPVLNTQLRTGPALRRA